MPFDKSKYPADWGERRARILDREKHCCKFCNVPNHATAYRSGDGCYTLDGVQWFDKQGKAMRVKDVNGASEYSPEGVEVPVGRIWSVRIILTTAHLDRTGAPGPNDGPLDCPDDRLAALCQRCHLKLDGERHKAKRAATLALRKAQPQLFDIEPVA